MASTGGSWFSANTLVNHSIQAKSLQPQIEAVRNDPNTLISFYDIVPTNDIALPQFEEWGIARLRSAHLLQLSVPTGQSVRNKRMLACSSTRYRTNYDFKQEGRGCSNIRKRIA